MQLITKYPKHNYSGEAASREQKRNADLDREKRNKELPTIFVKTYGFRPTYNYNDIINIQGPLCPSLITKDRQCLAPLIGDNESTTRAYCDVCGKSYEYAPLFSRV